MSYAIPYTFDADSPIPNWRVALLTHFDNAFPTDTHIEWANYQSNALSGGGSQLGGHTTSYRLPTSILDIRPILKCAKVSIRALSHPSSKEDVEGWVGSIDSLFEYAQGCADTEVYSSSLFEPLAILSAICIASQHDQQEHLREHLRKRKKQIQTSKLRLRMAVIHRMLQSPESIALLRKWIKEPVFSFRTVFTKGHPFTKEFIDNNEFMVQLFTLVYDDHSPTELFKMTETNQLYGREQLAREWNVWFTAHHQLPAVSAVPTPTTGRTPHVSGPRGNRINTHAMNRSELTSAIRELELNNEFLDKQKRIRAEQEIEFIEEPEEMGFLDELRVIDELIDNQEESRLIDSEAEEGEEEEEDEGENEAEDEGENEAEDEGENNEEEDEGENNEEEDEGENNEEEDEGEEEDEEQKSAQDENESADEEPTTKLRQKRRVNYTESTSDNDDDEEYKQPCKKGRIEPVLDRNEWATPQHFFDLLSKEFGGFQRDLAASEDNTKCSKYYDKSTDTLKKQWKGRCWLNPPYNNIRPFLQKAYESSVENGATIVCLVPASTGTKWWWDYALKGEIRFWPGRLQFTCGGKTTGSAPFASAIIIYRPEAPVCECCARVGNCKRLWDASGELE